MRDKMRDDFSQKTLDILAKRVGHRCSNPSCRKLTTGPRSESTLAINIGVGAHITAASPGGPRYNPELSASERSSIENGIWLCQNCSKLVDNDRSRYTEELLHEWKTWSEEKTLQEIESKDNSYGIVEENSIDLDISYKKIKMEQDRHDYQLIVAAKNIGIEPVSEYHVDLLFPYSVIESPESLSLFVKDRSDKDRAFFRFIYRNTDDIIYPRDTKVLIAFNYFMDDDLYWSRKQLFNTKVQSSFYRKGFGPVFIEKLFEELQFY